VLLCQQLDLLAQGKIDGHFQLELLEAAGKRSETYVQQRLQARQQAFAKDDELAPFRQCLQGGDGEKGRELFLHDERAHCVRCHSLDGTGGSAGPKLEGVGTRGDRQYILQSLIAPSAKIAEGYATVVLHLHNGDVVAGVVVKDQDGVVEIMDVDGKSTKVPADRIAQRTGSATSAMPPMGGVLKPRELRDLVEFLSRLK
jgi:putative heme-binding domain-containing protein